MENPLVYIIRGLPEPLDRSLTQALAEYLEECQRPDAQPNAAKLFRLLAAAGELMIPLPEYDIEDFRDSDIAEALQLLSTGDEQLWAQLLDALNDGHSPDYMRLKNLSPYAGESLIFFDITSEPSRLRLDVDETLGRELLKRADVHDFPGNSGMVVVPPEALDLLRFVDCVDEIPATA